MLALNLPQSRRTYDEESDEDDDEEQDAPVKPTKVKKDRLSNHQKDLLPLASKTRTSRLDRPTPSTSKVSLDEAEASSNNEEDEESDTAEEDEGDNKAEDEFDDEWARTGGYHVSKREIARMEEQASAPGGKFSADEQAEQRDALELYEARRIQKEAKDRLDETDYIDAEELEETGDKDEELLAVTRADRPTKTIQVPRFDSREEAIAHLLSKEPELLALLDDFSACTERLPLIQQTVKDMESDAGRNEKKIALGYLYQGRHSTSRIGTRLVTDISPQHRHIHNVPYLACFLSAYSEPPTIPYRWFSASWHRTQSSCEGPSVHFDDGRLRHYRPARAGEA